MELVVAFIIIAICGSLVQLEYAWIYGNSFASPKLKVCYVLEVSKDLAQGVGVFSIPKLECFPDYYGTEVFKEHTTLANAKWYAIKLRLKNPRKHYKVCFHY